jgi:hypothetical protein
MKHTKQQLIDIVITAVEGGINYWSQVSHYNPDKGMVTVYEIGEDGEVEKKHNLTTAVIRKGLKLALESEYEHIRFIAVTDIPDAEEADVIVQLGLFGEVIYG